MMYQQRSLPFRWGILILGVLLLDVSSAVAAIPAQERAALVAIYNALDGPNWKHGDYPPPSRNWLGPVGSECTWDLVKCDAADATVIELDLSYNSVRGVLPREIGDLSNLELFKSIGSAITGILPADIGRLSKLRILNLGEFGGNSISGPIPPELGQLTNLRELRLSGNKFTGTIPVQLGSLPNLEVLDLTYNPLGGEIPPALLRMSSLRRLTLGADNLTGSIPSPIALPNIEVLDLGGNRLTGTIPPSLAQSTKLTELHLSDNHLSGPIPSEFNQLTALTILHLEINELAGNLPTLANLTNLAVFWLHHNRLTGPLPSWIGQMPDLRVLIIGDNQFSGALPAELFTRTKLTWFECQRNRVSGNLADFGKLTALETLTIGGTDFRGPFPVELTQLEKLASLALTDIPLGGTLPHEIRLLKSLSDLQLDGTKLSSIPEEFGDLAQLTIVSLRSNALTKLPVSLSKLTNLTGLSVGHNQISGRIPSDTFGRMPKLNYLSLEDNGFDGPIPPDIFSAPELLEIYLNQNKLTGAVPSVGGAPKLQNLNLAENQLTALPADLGSLKQLSLLDLGSNNFSGPPPAAIGDLSTLYTLKLQDNHFSGPLPNLSKLTQLRALFLYVNQFSGPIPDWLGTMISLSSVILDSNKLSGRIPSSFTNLTNLAPGYGLGIRGNALYTNDPAVKTFLDSFDGQWDQSQTIAPTDVRVTAQRERSITLSWTPIQFTYGPGGYQIAFATSALGPFNILTTTPSKETSTFIADGLDPSTNYFFAVSAVSYPYQGQQNVVTSEAGPALAASTTTGAPAPASVVVFVYPYELRQRPGESGTTSYIIGNVGDLPANITLTQAGDLFTQDPPSFTLAGGTTQQIGVTGRPQVAGAYTGNALIAGNGVPAGLSLRISMLVIEPPTGTVNALPSANRIDVAAKITDSASGSVDFTNTGAATLQGIVTSNVAWIIPPTDLIVIPAGQTRTVNFTVDQAKRPDASSPAGAVTGTLSLDYESGGAASKTTPNDVVTVPKTAPVTVVYTITPPVQAVSIPQFAAGEVGLFVVGAGNVTGVKGTYISDVSIVNVFGVESPKDIKMYYSPSDPTLGTQVTDVQQLEPNKGVTFANVVKSVFDNATLGTIQIRTQSLDQLFVNANIFNVTDRNGTYGTALPIFRSDRALQAGESLFLTGLRRDAEQTTYTNVFIQETSGGTASYEIEYFDAAGQTVGDKRTGTVSQFRMAQRRDDVPVGAVAARITNVAGSGGRIIAYATPLDAVSGDFWAVADWNHENGAALDEPVIIPVAGRVHGALNTFFRTDLAVTNRSTAAAGGALTFFDRGGAIRERDLALAGGQSLILSDIVGTSFPDLSEPLGYLEFDPRDNGSFSLTSRTFATQPTVQGTFGTGVPVLPRSAALRLGQSKIITGLDVASPQTTNNGTPGTFRTNIGLVEIDGKPATVEVTVIYNDIRQLVSGIRLTTLRYDVSPHGTIGANLALEIRKGNPNVSDLRSVQLKFRVISGDGAVIAYTSSVDNGTGDTVFRVQ